MCLAAWWALRFFVSPAPLIQSAVVSTDSFSWNMNNVAYRLEDSIEVGRLVAGVLGSIAEFERARIQERVRAGLARVRAQGRRLGRKPCAVSDHQFAAVASLSTRLAAERLGISHTVVARWRAVNKTPPEVITNTPVIPASAQQA